MRTVVNLLGFWCQTLGRRAYIRQASGPLFLSSQYWIPASQIACSSERRTNCAHPRHPVDTRKFTSSNGFIETFYPFPLLLNCLTPDRGLWSWQWRHSVGSESVFLLHSRACTCLRFSSLSPTIFSWKFRSAGSFEKTDGHLSRTARSIRLNLTQVAGQLRAGSDRLVWKDPGVHPPALGCFSHDRSFCLSAPWTVLRMISLASNCPGWSTG